MNFTLLQRKFENVGRIEFENQEVEEIRWNGETVWKRDPCFIAVTNRGKLLIYDKAVDLRSTEIEIDVSIDDSIRQVETCCIHKNTIFVGGNNGTLNGEIGSPTIWERTDSAWFFSTFWLDMPSGSVKFVRSNNDYLVAVLLSEDEKTLQIHRSEDGVMWEKTFEKTWDFKIDVHSFTYCNGKFNLSVNFGTFVSENAEDWVDLGFDKYHYDIFYHDGKYIESEIKGIYFGYELGKTSKAIGDNFDDGLGRISYHNGLYFCGVRYYSRDGMTWNVNNYPWDISNVSSTDGKEGVFYDGTKYHLFGQTDDNSARLYSTSDDGITWKAPVKLSGGLILDYQCSY